MPKFSDDWNKEPALSNNSCYNYALDRRSTGKKGKNLNPGDASGKKVLTPHNCKDVVAALEADKLDTSSKTKKCPDKCWKIVCLRAPGSQPDPDIHFYRQDDDGTWSHKRGGEKATNVGVDGKAITDPEKDGRSLKPSYSELCGYFCVCPDKIKAIEVAMLAPQVGAQGFAAVNVGACLELSIQTTTLYIPAGKVVVLYDFTDVSETTAADLDPTITASLFSLLPNPYWYLTTPQANTLVAKVGSLRRFRRAAPNAKPFGGFRVDGLALEDRDHLWITEGMIYAVGIDGREWVTPDTLGLEDEISAEFKERFPCYAAV